MMTKRLAFSLLALIIGSTVSLASCGDEKGASSSLESISDSEDISTEASVGVSEDALTELTNSFAIPDGFKGHLMEDALAVVDFGEGFGVAVSCSDSLGDVGMDIYLKEGFAYVGLSIAGYETALLFTDGKSYSLDRESGKYQLTKDIAEDIWGTFASLEIVNGSLVYDSTFEESLQGKPYVVEQYNGESSPLKCYFSDGELVFYEYNQVLVNISLTDKIPAEILNLPDGYEGIVPEDVIAVPDDYKDLAIGKALSGFNGEDGFAITLKVTATSIDGSILSTTTTTTSIKGDKVRTDKRYMNEVFDTAYTNLYLDEKMYQLYHMQRNYAIFEGRYLSSGERLFDVLEYKRTETEAIGDVSYTVDVFRITSMGMMASDKDFEVKFYTHDGRWKYLSCDIDLTGQPMPCAPLLCFRGLADVDIAVLEDTDEIFEIPDGYVLEKD